MHLGSLLNLSFLLLLQSLLPLLLSHLSLPELNLSIQRGEGSKKGRTWFWTGRSRLTHEDEAQRAAKQQKVSRAAQRGLERSNTQPPEPRAWLPAPMHDGEPLGDDASLRDFNRGIGCHVASIVEKALLLLQDMTKLQGIRKNEVFLHCKRYLGMV